MKSLWQRVNESIVRSELNLRNLLKDGQYESLLKISHSMLESGVILADEVGLGKTFIALALADQVIKEGGMVVIVVPPGLLFQWEAELSKFHKLFKLASPNSITKEWKSISLRRYWDLAFHPHWHGQYAKDPLLNFNEHPLLLMTHKFSTPRVQYNSRIESFELPSLYWGAKHELSGTNQNTKFWYQVKKNNEGSAYLNFIKRMSLAEISFTNEELSYLNDENNRILIESVGEDRKRKIIDSFYLNGIGAKITCKLISSTIGTFDLAIIDEAHKSKGDDDHSTELTKLLTQILRLNAPDKPLTRILGMTATPVEMSVEQWGHLLKRIGIDAEMITKKGKVIESFANSLNTARVHPDHAGKVRDLISQSNNFEQSLKTTVYRRRKFDLSSNQELTKHSHKKQTSHPNRRLNEVAISYQDLPQKWRHSILAFDGIAKAAKGLDTKTALKILDSRYPSGLIQSDLITERIVQTEDLNISENAQIGRIEYYKNIVQDLDDSETDDIAHLYSHPRIQKTADHIESVLYNSEFNFKNEKILVFGTYTKPLRALNNILNQRYILRQMDKDLPVRTPHENPEEVKQLFAEYQRIANKSNSDLKFFGQLNRSFDESEFFNLIQQKFREYLNIQKTLNKFFNDEENTSESGFIEKLPGNSGLEKLKKSGKIEIFFSFLEVHILNELLQNHNLFAQYQQEGKKRSDKITEIAIQIWSNYLLAQTTAEDDGDNDHKSGWVATSNESHVKADRYGDQLSVNQILEILKEDEVSKNPHRSAFSRFMSGNTKMPVRRTLQLQFNNPEALPMVLLAQSAVGREGLNLHECCRRIVLFHPEWNPAVVEQQIGRVDRINSLWERLAKEFNEAPNIASSEFPYIEVDFIIFEGTYDQYQFETMKMRRENLAAQLFGALLPEECMALVPDSLREELAQAAPNFSPIRVKV
jgi:superfamily II DNA or RNA helicase